MEDNWLTTNVFQIIFTMIFQAFECPAGQSHRIFSVTVPRSNQLWRLWFLGIWRLLLVDLEICYLDFWGNKWSNLTVGHIFHTGWWVQPAWGRRVQQFFLFAKCGFLYWSCCLDRMCFICSIRHLFWGKPLANLGASVALVLGIVFWKWGDVDIHWVEAAIQTLIKVHIM